VANVGHVARLPPFNAAHRALGAKHFDDLLRAFIAEELAQRFLVPRDAVFLHQRDEVSRRVARERRAAEVGIRRKEIAVGRVQVGEVAASTPRDADLLAHLAVVVDEQHAAGALARSRGAHHARCASADHRDVECVHRRH